MLKIPAAGGFSCSNSDKQREILIIVLDLFESGNLKTNDFETDRSIYLDKHKYNKNQHPLFMSRLVPDWSQVKPGNPGAPVTHKSHLYLEIRDEQRTKWQADTGQEVPVGSRSRYYVRMVISLDIITAVLWDSVDKTDLRSSIPRWVWQRWHSKGPGGSCPALKINWLMIQIFMLSLSLSLIKTIP